MKRINRSILLICAFLMSNNLVSQDIIVGIFSAVPSSQTIATVSGTTTTFKPNGGNSILKVGDLNAALAIGNVILDAPQGNIGFVGGTFTPQTAGRTMYFYAAGSVGITFVGGNQNQISMVVCAGSTLQINGPGVNLNGGSFRGTAGGNISILNTGLNTGGGNVDLRAQGNVEISGVGMITGGGNVVLEGINLNSQNLNLLTANPAIGGSLSLNFSGDISFSGPGFKAGKLDAYGRSFISTFGGPNQVVGTTTNQGDANLNMTNNISIAGAGLTVSGDLTMYGANVTLGGTGLRTLGTDVNMCISGNVDVLGLGILSWIDPNLNTPGGNVSIQTTGYVSLRSGGGIFTGYAYANGPSQNSEGGDVSIIADSIYLVGASINTGVKSTTGALPEGYMAGTGTLTTFPAIGTPSKIVVENSGVGVPMPTPYTGGLIPANPIFRFKGPYVGGGDVILDVVNAPSCLAPVAPSLSGPVACMAPAPIPSIGFWSLLVLGFSVLIVGVAASKKALWV